MEPLTEVQQELYDYLLEKSRRHKPMPTYREMMRAMRLKSPAPIQGRLDRLERKGYIYRPSHNARSIIVNDFEREGTEPVYVPQQYVVQVLEFVETLQDLEAA
ncbi:MAG: hypothetical protein AAGD09_03150 [Cyanobacteria bacterium P01_F01_bin.56]